MATKKPINYVNIMVILLIFAGIFIAPVEFYSKSNVGILVHRMSVAVVLTCGFSFLLTLGRLDFSIGAQLAFLGSLLNVADGVWHLNPLLIVLMTFSFSSLIGFWHYYWIDVRNIPASFITGLSSVFFFIAITNFLPPENMEPYSLFFYVLALNPLSNVAIYSIIVTLLFSFFILYYLRLSSRLQYNLRTDQWIPFLILVLTLTSLGLAGFIRLHEYIQFRLIFFIGLLVFIAFFVMERFSRLGRRIHTIGSEPEVAFLAGIPVGRVRRNTWILYSFLAGLLALFFQGGDVIFTSTESTAIQGLILSAGLLGGLSGNSRRMSILQSVIAVVCLVCFESILRLVGFQPVVMAMANAGFFFLALSVSRFKPGQVT